MVEFNVGIGIKWQCELLEISRASVYYERRERLKHLGSPLLESPHNIRWIKIPLDFRTLLR